MCINQRVNCNRVRGQVARRHLAQQAHTLQRLAAGAWTAVADTRGAFAAASRVAFDQHVTKAQQRHGG